jgi:predicted DNA-binding transcriptional regulator AlpA
VSDFLKTKQAAERIGVHKSTLLRRLRRGDPVPPVVRVDHKTLRWRVADVDAWVAARTDSGDERREGKL